MDPVPEDEEVVSIDDIDGGSIDEDQEGNNRNDFSKEKIDPPEQVCCDVESSSASSASGIIKKDDPPGTKKVSFSLIRTADPPPHWTSETTTVTREEHNNNRHSHDRNNDRRGGGSGSGSSIISIMSVWESFVSELMVSDPIKANDAATVNHPDTDGENNNNGNNFGVDDYASYQDCEDGGDDDEKNNDNRTNEDSITTERNEIMFMSLSSMPRKLRDANIVYSLPFFMTIATRLPFIYFVIQLEDEFGISFAMIGLFVGLFHFCRVLAIVGTLLLTPKWSQLVGTLLAIAGYLSLLVTRGNTLFAFAASNIAVGLAEASAAVNVYAKDEFGNDLNKLRMALRTQSTVIGIAVIFGFFFGGMAFQMYGVAGIAVSGIIVLSLELASLIYFLLGDTFSSDLRSNKNMDEEDEDEESSEHNKAGSTPNRISTVTTGAVVSAITKGHAPNALLSKFSANDMFSANSFTYLVAAVFSVESIAAGYLFSIGPLFMNEAFGTETGMIGIIFSSASLFGTGLTLFAISSVGRNWMKRKIPSPYNLYFLIATISGSVLGAMIPVFGVHVLSILLLIGASELFLTLLSDLQGAVTTARYYAILGPSGQMFRRLMNVVMATTGPIAYGAFPRLPYLIAGCICVLFTLVFITSVERQRKRNAAKLRAVHARHHAAADCPDNNHQDDDDECHGEPDSSNARRLSLATQEVLTRLASLAKVRGENSVLSLSSFLSHKSKAEDNTTPHINNGTP